MADEVIRCLKRSDNVPTPQGGQPNREEKLLLPASGGTGLGLVERKPSTVGLTDTDSKAWRTYVNSG